MFKENIQKQIKALIWKKYALLKSSLVAIFKIEEIVKKKLVAVVVVQQ